MQSPTNNEQVQSHIELSDIEFARQFENLHLNPEWFTHEAHLRLAWIYSYIYDIEKAINKFRNGIHSFDSKYGDGTKYHETITIFLIKLVYEREKTSSSLTFDKFKERNLDLFQCYRDLISAYYSFDIAKDRNAKLEFIAPDLKNLA